MTIKQLQEECHKIAIEKGFWDGINHNMSEKLMLIVSELGEACEALRKQDFQINCLGLKGKWRKNTFEDELTDALIRILDLSMYLGIDLEWQLKNKIKYNKKREYKHGKAF